MAKKRLSVEQINTMKDMVQKGVAPEDIANHFNIAISSVHNYKARFKEEGVSFPSVRGRRPSGTVNDPHPPVTSTPMIGQMRSQPSSVNTGDSYKFIVNGTSVQISGNAKNINIGKDGMEINF